MPTIQFIALDTYEHIPRNFFGFKKKGVPTETRIAALTIHTIDDSPYGIIGDVRSLALKGAKIGEDPEWNEKYLPPADYRKVRYAADITDAIGRASTSDAVCWDGSQYMVSDAIRTFNPAPGYQGREFPIEFSTWLTQKLSDIPQEHFVQGMASGKYDILINCPVGEEDTWRLTAKQKYNIFMCHERYPTFRANDNTKQTCIKMMEAYSLFKSIKREVENARAK